MQPKKLVVLIFFIFSKQFSRNFQQYINSAIIQVFNTETINKLLVPTNRN